MASISTGALAVKDAWLSLVRRLWVLAAVFLIVQTGVRATLAARAGWEFVSTPADLVRPFVLGFWFDAVVLAAAAIPFVLYWLALPNKWRGRRFDTAMTFGTFVLGAFLIGFTAVGEHLFWTEFGTRFNFIAVDYLVYTTEVLGDIWESYPVGSLLSALLAVVLLVTWSLRRSIRPMPDRLTVAARAGGGGRSCRRSIAANRHRPVLDPGERQCAGQ